MADRSGPKIEPVGPGPASVAANLVPPPNVRQRTFAALHYPNYRPWFQRQLVSMVGTWMQVTTQGFLVFELTHSTAYLGYVGFAAGVPSLLFMLFGGVIADRVAVGFVLFDSTRPPETFVPGHKPSQDTK